MTLCYIDAFSGLAGDMLVGALADAGADRSALQTAVASLDIGATVRFERVMRRGIAAEKFYVDAPEQKAHRHLSGILKIVDRADLAPRAKDWSRKTFERLGSSEAAVHGVPIERVHFHEVGAIDSIVDVVCACAGFDLLNAERVVCSAVNTGSGSVETEHGTLPVPAPATASLLKGVPVYARGPQMELTTPTGAAVITTLAESFGALPPMRIRSIGYGAGDRDFPSQANVVRIVIGDAATVPEATEIVVIEANIDDSSPEVIGYALERLMELGALDASCESLLMKKGRPGTLLRVVARPEDRESLAAVIFAETSTLGIRSYKAERIVQERESIQVETRFGNVRVKATPSGQFAPEYEDCRARAREHGVALKAVMAEAAFAYQKRTR